MGEQHTNLTFVGGAKATGLPTPSASSDAATKAYVDAAAGGRRAPDMMLRPGIFGAASFVGPGSAVSTGTLGQSGTSASSLLASLMRLQVFGNGAGADDVAALSWGWNDLSDTGIVWRGDAAGRGGFRQELLFNPVGLCFVANPIKGFFGLDDTVLGASDDLFASAVSCIGVGFDAAAGNALGSEHMFLIHNDGSGAPTTTDLGADFPVKDQLYFLVLEAAPNASGIDYELHNLTNGESVSGTVTSNIPAADTFMGMHAEINKDGSDTNVFQLDIVLANGWQGSTSGSVGVGGV